MAIAYDGGLLRTAGPMTQLVVPPPGPPREGEPPYSPAVDDVWVVGLLRPAGVLVIAQAGWTLAGTWQDVPDPDGDGRPGELSLWWHRVHDACAALGAVTLTMDRAVWAKAMLRVFRAADRESGAAEELAQGWASEGWA